MKRFLVLILAVFLVWGYATTAYSGSSSGQVYQIAPLAALMQGEYDGPTTFGELRKNGDFGIGTVNGLDGEMIALDGRFYRIALDGTVTELKDSAKTPFAVVVFFTNPVSHSIRTAMKKNALQKSIDGLLEGRDRFHAVKIHGTFSYVKVRSVPKQHKPYVPLMKALEAQAVFELHDVTGDTGWISVPRVYERRERPRLSLSLH